MCGCLVETHGFTLLVFVNKLFGLCFCFQNVHLGCVFLFGMFIFVVFGNKLFALSFGFQNVYFCCVCKSIVFLLCFQIHCFLWLCLQIHCLDCCKIVVDRRVTGMNAGLEILEQISINWKHNKVGFKTFQHLKINWKCACTYPELNKAWKHYKFTQRCWHKKDVKVWQNAVNYVEKM